jgi:adenylosuccinate synthase
VTVQAVIGLQWGDEGKGKIVDLLSHRAEFVVRYQGGANAGHTVVIKGVPRVIHLVPSGVFHPRCLCVLGAGVMIDPTQLLEEIDALERSGISLEGRLLVSERAHLVFEYHKALDRLDEASRGTERIGTTGRGIGPCTVDKVARRGVRLCDLFDEPLLEKRLRAGLERTNPRLAENGEPPLEWALLLAETRTWRERLAPYVADTERRLAEGVRAGASILLEGAQGALLDLDHGTYPYVTSSNPGTAGISSGCGIPPTSIDRCLGVTKAYTTRVGEGPFPTEQTGPLGDRLREIGSEFGTTTGRPRRCGWLDGVALAHAVRLNGVDRLAVTKLDCLSGIGPLRLARAYRVGPHETEAFPSRLDDLARAEPVYEEYPGFDLDLASLRRYDDLPGPAREFLAAIEEIAGATIEIVSVGPDREQTIQRA